MGESDNILCLHVQDDVLATTHHEHYFLRVTSDGKQLPENKRWCLLSLNPSIKEK